MSLITATLGDVCDFVRGLTYSKKDEIAYSNNSVLRANNIDLKSHTLNLSEIRYIKNNVIIKDEKKVKRCDILICIASGSKSHLGKVALIDKELNMAFGGFMGVLRAKPSIHSPYLFKVLVSDHFKKHLEALSDGSNINNLKFSLIKDFKFPLPPLEEQKAIVTKLDTAFAEIDKSIGSAQNKRSEIKKLKISVLSTYLENSKKESNKGFTINCEVKKLSDITIVIAGQSPEGKNYNKEGRGTPFYQGKKDYGEQYLKKPTVWTTKVSKEALAKDILLSVRAPVGSINIAQERICIGRGLAAIRAESEVDRAYLYYFLKMLGPQLQGKSGAVFNSINKKQIENILIPLPHLEEQKAIVAKLDTIFAKVEKVDGLIIKNIQNYLSLKKNILHSKLQMGQA